MKTKIIALCLVAIAGTFIYASGKDNRKQVKPSNNYITSEIEVGNFHAIHVQAGAVEVLYTQNSHENTGVKIYGPDNLVEVLQVKEKDRVLTIAFEKGVSVNGNKNKAKIMITNPEIRKISVSGAADIVLKNSLRTQEELEFSVGGVSNITGEHIVAKNIKTSISGVSNMTLDHISTGELTAGISGVGNIKLAGKAENASYKISDKGNIKALKLATNHTQASVSGIGNVDCYADEVLKGKVSGLGKINYKGDARIEGDREKIKKL
ncbi:MAG: DUF2807 domain-containing protein [Bacteroides sp.]|nr:DUF2807 domain-containing protein [Bacteroides sp.]